MFCIYLADRYWTGTDVRGGAAAAHMRGTVTTGTGTLLVIGPVRAHDDGGAAAGRPRRWSARLQINYLSCSLEISLFFVLLFFCVLIDCGS